MPNLSQLKRERMLAFLQKIKDEHRDDDDMLIALGEIESELTSKKYGLVWEQHEESVDVMMRDNIPVFTEVPEREITATPNHGYNFILEGDNLHSLRLLEKTHKGKIDLIYIDPPYNTGNKDFIYDDAFVDKTDLFMHSKWLSFMEKRLKIARQLLSETGVIFISIDDNEQAQLKMLCDEIFGANNFVADIAWEKADSPRMDAKLFSTRFDHTLVFARNIELISIKQVATEEVPDHYNKTEPNGRRYYLKPLSVLPSIIALTALSDKLELEVCNRQAQETFAPCVEVCLADGTPTGLAFHGVPSGHEFTSFVLGLYNAAGPGQAIDEDTKQKIATATKPIDMKILVTLSCTMCPDLVVATQRIAAASPNITAHVYDIRHFEHLKDQYKVMSVPCLVVNNKDVFFGKKNIRQILDLIYKLRLP